MVGVAGLAGEVLREAMGSGDGDVVWVGGIVGYICSKYTHVDAGAMYVLYIVWC
jgi:hypothetical protein